MLGWHGRARDEAADFLAFGDGQGAWCRRSDIRHLGRLDAASRRASLIYKSPASNIKYILVRGGSRPLHHLLKLLRPRLHGLRWLVPRCL